MQFKSIIPWRLKFLASILFSWRFWERYFQETKPMGRVRALALFVKCFFLLSNPTKVDKKAGILKVRDLGDVSIYAFSDFYIFLEIFVLRTYALETLTPPNRIIDIGANIGMFSLRCRQLFPKAHIRSFEPVASNFIRLQENLAGKMDNVSLNNCGVSDHRGTADIFLHPMNSGGHSLFSIENTKATEKETIQLVDVNDIFDQTSEPIDILKLDCEGAEQTILAGLSLENAARIKTILIEPMFGLYDKDTFLTRLEDLGFKYHFSNDLLVAVNQNPMNSAPN